MDQQESRIKLERPFGVGVIALLLIAISTVFIALSLLLMLQMPTFRIDPAMAAITGIKQPQSNAMQDALLMGILFFGLSLVAGFGLLQLLNWSRWLVMFQAAYLILSVLVKNLSTPLTGGSILCILLCLSTIFYLNQSHVRQAFSSADRRIYQSDEPENDEVKETEFQQMSDEEFNDTEAEFIPPEPLGLTRKRQIL